ncbi:hypothetical protein [Aliarcobacter butzleri]|uniref:hypothetical protein n=1 Tax=Aliarcobacter butzleri TaxID=28197 RepID=UPI00158744F1|nr:hypothetical protein [Aliarcobacter butzleri]NUW29632.1 hypothetical protein [Aliarcobacter butzleri]
MKKFGILILILILNTSLLASKLTEKEISEWGLIGVDKMFIENWRSQGVKTPNDAKKWLDAGETRVSISQWKNINITNPDDAIKWKKTKLNFKDIQKALKVKLTAEILDMWYKEGILFEETIVYYTRRINNLEDAKKWKTFNIKNDQDFENLFRNNINSLSEMEKWANLGLSLSDINKWKYYRAACKFHHHKLVNL